MNARDEMREIERGLLEYGFKRTASDGKREYKLIANYGCPIVLTLSINKVDCGREGGSFTIAAMLVAADSLGTYVELNDYKTVGVDAIAQTLSAMRDKLLASYAWKLVRPSYYPKQTEVLLAVKQGTDLPKGFSCTLMSSTKLAGGINIFKISTNLKVEYATYYICITGQCSNRYIE
jgi:hypothetical protein